WASLEESLAPAPGLAFLALSRLSPHALSFLKLCRALKSLTVTPPRRGHHEPPSVQIDQANNEKQDAFAALFWTDVIPELKNTLTSLAVCGSGISPAWMWDPYSASSHAVETCSLLKELEMCACGPHDEQAPGAAAQPSCRAHAFIESVL